MDIEEGAVVRHRGWGGRFVGTVTRRDGDGVFVTWYGSCVEDKLRADELDLVPSPPADLASWRGGIGIIGAGGSWHVEPCEDER